MTICQATECRPATTSHWPKFIITTADYRCHPDLRPTYDKRPAANQYLLAIASLLFEQGNPMFPP
ncbi:hypothetical protein CW304_20575 [Bacillus sp. UFRGS-B20]|nr:hypothetical protein CW304_20575 [Bacillus sp. UFRGS-B20]